MYLCPNYPHSLNFFDLFLSRTENYMLPFVDEYGVKSQNFLHTGSQVSKKKKKNWLLKLIDFS